MDNSTRTESNSIPLGVTATEGTTTTLDFERKFEEGALVSGMYFSGIAGKVTVDMHGYAYYMVTVKDKDERINGRAVPMYEYDLREGSLTTFEEEVAKIRNKDDSNLKRERTYGEHAVGLDLANGGIDANPVVCMFKNMCADLIDEVKIKIGENEKEAMVLIPVDVSSPSYMIAAHNNIRDQYIVAIDKIVKLKHRLVSAATGNNDKIS